MYNNAVYTAELPQSLADMAQQQTVSVQTPPVQQSSMNFALLGAVFIVTAVILLAAVLYFALRPQPGAKKTKRRADASKHTADKNTAGQSSLDVNKSKLLSKNAGIYDNHFHTPENKQTLENVSSGETENITADSLKLGTPDNPAQCIKNFLEITKDI